VGASRRDLSFLPGRRAYLAADGATGGDPCERIAILNRSGFYILPGRGASESFAAEKYSVDVVVNYSGIGTGNLSKAFAQP